MNKTTKSGKTAAKKRVVAITHDKQSRSNIPTAEMEGLVPGKKKEPLPVKYPRKHSPDETPEHYKRNTDLDPQLVWTGKDDEDRQHQCIDAMPIYVQEKIQPRAIIEDLRRRLQQEDDTGNLFADFNGLSAGEGVQFYKHAQRWTNRMILGDSLKVMASLARKEGLKGKVQCVYVDPPYGINYSSNWQPSTNDRGSNDNNESHEPEMIRAFRDTWKLGVNSYLSYLRDRLVVACDLLTESGSIFLQISDENVHLVRSVMDEIFGRENFVSLITFTKTNPLGSSNKRLARTCDYLIWYAKNIEQMKYHPLFFEKKIGKGSAYQHVELADGIRRKMTTEEKSDFSLIPPKADIFSLEKLFSTGYTKTCFYDFEFNGHSIKKGSKSWRTTLQGMMRLIQSGRIHGDGRPAYVSKFSDFSMRAIDHLWNDTGGATDMVYVVQTSAKVIQRCILMTTDPGDLVLDPTCGGGTTASVAEQWGRRWITCDTSRVALALARSRLMNNVYPYYLLKDSKEGADIEAGLSNQPHGKVAFAEDVRQGFVYKRVPHITLRAIANNVEISEIYARYQDKLEVLRKKLNAETENNFAEWEIPRDIPEKKTWSKKAKDIHVAWWKARIARQQEIDESIKRSADTEMLVDRPYEAKNTVRVTGPFTVESLSPHRIIPPSDVKDSPDTRPKSEINSESRFWDVVYEHLKFSGVKNNRKDERLKFTELEPWPGGEYIQFLGRYLQKNGKEKKVAVCVGPEYDTVTRGLLVDAAREAADMFDMLIVLGFAFEAYADESMASFGDLSVWCVHMDNDLHMGERLASKKIDGSNLFVSLGEPEIKWCTVADDMIEVKILGIDIFNPTTGALKSRGVEDIACWMIDTDYNGQSFFVRHAYFCGTGKDPYKQLKKALKAEISGELWDTLRASVSRPFAKPKTGKIAVKAINHHGDEVMKVFSIN